MAWCQGLFFLYCILYVIVMCSVLHDQRLAHTDLKPENILFVNSDYEYCGTKRIHHKVSKLRVYDLDSSVPVPVLYLSVCCCKVSK